MLELVLANLRVRPFRTLISVVGVALGVVLIVLFTGLARGMLNDMTKRSSNWKAELVFARAGSFETLSSNASVNTKYVDLLEKVPGVESAVPMLRYFAAGQGNFGLRQIDGVDWDKFAQMNEIKIVRGCWRHNSGFRQKTLQSRGHFCAAFGRENENLACGNAKRARCDRQMHLYFNQN
jgi:hypothetical protein